MIVETGVAPDVHESAQHHVPGVRQPLKFSVVS